MIILNLNETFQNNTNKDIECITEYYNCFGYKQKTKTILSPGTSIFSSNPLNRTYIYN